MQRGEQDLVEGAVALAKAPLGRLVSIFEDARPGAAAKRKRVHAALSAHPRRREASFIGVTGAPGSGKSSLVGELALRLAAADTDLAVAVLAVDPSSHRSGGALLGDRTRVRLPAGERRLFFRSQSSGLELGGLGRASFQVCRALRHLFDVVFVETVGIGQSEIEIRVLGDATLVVMPPLAGDHVQFMKAGLMEIPDVLAVHKSDQGEPAEVTYRTLKATLDLSHAGDGTPAPAVVKTSVETGAGLAELCAELRSRAERRRGSFADKEAYFFEGWIRGEFGRYGLRRLPAIGGTAAEFLAASGGFDDAQAAFARALLGDDAPGWSP